MGCVYLCIDRGVGLGDESCQHLLSGGGQDHAGSESGKRTVHLGLCQESSTKTPKTSPHPRNPIMTRKTHRREE